MPAVKNHRLPTPPRPGPEPTAARAAPPSRGRPSWSGLLRLSLVSVPVKAYPAVTSTSTSPFHLLHARSAALRQVGGGPEDAQVCRFLIEPARTRRQVVPSDLVVASLCLARIYRELLWGYRIVGPLHQVSNPWPISAIGIAHQRELVDG